jgi:hypothetical protein
MSLVQGHPRSKNLAVTGRFAAAFTLSSFAVFAVAGLVGVVAARALSEHAEIGIACAVLGIALALDAYSLRRKTWCPVTLRRQTPKKILLQFGSRYAAIAWGLDTGLVFTTYRMTSIVWALFALTATGFAPWWIGLGYAAGFLTPLVLGCQVLRLRADPADGTGLARTLARYPQVARVTCVTALAAAVGVTVGTLIG